MESGAKEQQKSCANKTRKITLQQKKTFYFSFDEHFGSRFFLSLYFMGKQFQFRGHSQFNVCLFFEESKLLFRLLTAVSENKNAKCGLAPTF
jgi:hypothetical protein